MDISLPPIVEYIKTETLKGGRVRTRLFWFMMDDRVFDSMAAAIITGELSHIECRIGATIKHPKDKYDKTVAKQEAAKKLRKHKLKVVSLHSVPEKGTDILVSIEGGEVMRISKSCKNKITAGM